MISVIIPVYNNREIKDCLEAIKKNNYPDKEVIVINNNSSDSEIKKIIEQYQVKHIVEKNPGSYHARNRGAQESQGDILAFVDADCVIDENWFQQIEKNITKADALMGQIKNINKNKIAQLEGRFYEEVTQAAWQEKNLKRIDTRNFVIKKNIFQKLTGFNAQLKYGADMELGARLHAANYKIIYCSHLIIEHINEISIYKIIKKRIKQNADNHNIIKFHNQEFIKKYFPHLLRYPNTLGAKALRLYFKIILLANWPLMSLNLLWLPGNLKYIYFKGLNVLAIKYGLLSNVVQKNI